MRHDTVSRSVRFAGLFLRLRLPRTLSLWVGNEAPLLALSLRRHGGTISVHIQLVCVSLLLGTARSTLQPVTTVI